MLLFLWTIPLVALGAEALARSPLGAGLPTPSIGADSFVLDAKLYALESQIRRDSRVDCLFVGSSVSNSDIDPAVVEKIYREQTGETIQCYNIGIPVMTADNTVAFSRALIQRFHPKVIFFTVLPRDISPFEFNADFLENSAWVQHNIGNPSLSGWLVSNSYAYRYFLSWRYLLIPANRVKRNAETASLTPKGFQPAQGVHPPDPNNPFSTAQELQKIWDDPAHMASITSALTLQTQGTQLVLIEGPLNRSSQVIGASQSAWDAYESAYLPPLAQALKANNIPFWRTDEISLQIPSAHWYDWRHLNSQGALTFSQWLGEQLSQNSWLFK